MAALVFRGSICLYEMPTYLSELENQAKKRSSDLWGRRSGTVVSFFCPNRFQNYQKQGQTRSSGMKFLTANDMSAILAVTLGDGKDCPVLSIDLCYEAVEVISPEARKEDAEDEKKKLREKDESKSLAVILFRCW
ncbi:hypothetical protein AgCh_024897 [Apium graveolens]